jgi:hypothetical protein
MGAVWAAAARALRASAQWVTGAKLSVSHPVTCEAAATTIRR